MAETGYQFATSSQVSTGSWANVSNFFATDGTEATCSIAAKNTSSVCTLHNFGFTTTLLPSDATVNQVFMQCVWRVNTAASVIANLGVAVHLSSVGLLTTYLNSDEITTLTTDTFDITADRPWTPTDFRDGMLTVHVRPNNGNDASDPSYRFDSVSLNAIYTPFVPAAQRVLRSACNLDGVGPDGLLLGNALE